MNPVAIDVNTLIGTHDVLLVTIDTLRYDVARDAIRAGRTPNLAAVLPGGAWEPRHTPASFTYAAHQAFFAGFLPTPIAPGKHPRPSPSDSPAVRRSPKGTFVFDAPDIVSGLAALGYHTLCIGGVGFFNKQSPWGTSCPSLFAESHWTPGLGVTDPRSTENQVALAVERLAALPPGRRVFLFLNVSAVHQPNRFYLEGAVEDSIASHAAALAYVDRHLPRAVRDGPPARAGLLHRSARTTARPTARTATTAIAWGTRSSGRCPMPNPSCQPLKKRGQAPRRLGASPRFLRDSNGGRAVIADTGQSTTADLLLTDSPYQGYAYSYPHKTAYRPLDPTGPAGSALGR